MAVYAPSTLEQVDLQQVTTPLYNNAVMVTQAINGDLKDPAKAAPAPGELESSNPVVQFILSSNPK